MDIDHLTEKERYDMLSEMAELYYNQGKTQSEIAQHFETNRFRVAKLLQDARTEQIVEIKVNHSNERDTILENELKKHYPALQKTIVVNTRYSSYIDGMLQLGKAGATYLQKLLKPETVIGITWGKTVHSAVSQLVSAVHNPVTAVQLTGYMKSTNPAVDSRELVRAVASAYNGNYYYLDAPKYIQNQKILSILYEEPTIRETINQMKKMDVILSGIGSKSSLPLTNPIFKEYLTGKDKLAEKDCIGSLYGYVLNRSGVPADIELNQKRIGASMEDIMNVPHRIVIANGRHKSESISRALEQNLFNELIIDSDTALHLMENI